MNCINKIMLSIMLCTSPICYGGLVIDDIVSKQIQINCAKDTTSESWVVYDGIPGVQYTLKTLGIIDTEQGAGIIDTVTVGQSILSKTKDNLYVAAEARCIPRNGKVSMSATDNTLTCHIGEGIKIRLSFPIYDYARYFYVGSLTLVKYKIVNDSIDDMVAEVEELRLLDSSNLGFVNAGTVCMSNMLGVTSFQ